MMIFDAISKWFNKNENHLPIDRDEFGYFVQYLKNDGVTEENYRQTLFPILLRLVENCPKNTVSYVASRCLLNSFITTFEFIYREDS